jgi:hypothetical protein
MEMHRPLVGLLTSVALAGILGACGSSERNAVEPAGVTVSTASAEATPTSDPPDTVPATTPASSTIPPDLPDRIGPVIRSQEYESSDPNAELPASIAEGTLRLIDDCLILDTDPLLFALVLPYGTSWDETTDTVDMGIAIAVGDRIESGSPIAIENVATLIDNGHLSPDGAAELQRCIDVSGTPSAMELRGRH